MCEETNNNTSGSGITFPRRSQTAPQRLESAGTSPVDLAFAPSVMSLSLRGEREAPAGQARQLRPIHCSSTVQAPIDPKLPSR